MVAAAKLKRSQDRILAARPYAHKMRGVLGNLSQRVNRFAHPLLQKRDARRIEVVVVTSDRGLCGGFNGNIVRRAAEFLRQSEARGLEVTLSIVGRKGRDYFRRRSWTIRQEWAGVFDKLSFEHAIDIGGDLTDQFLKGTFDELYVVYNEFKSAIQQRVIVEKLFPVDVQTEFGVARAEGVRVRVRRHVDAHACEDRWAAAKLEASLDERLLRGGQEAERSRPHEHLSIDREAQRRLVMGGGHEDGPLGHLRHREAPVGWIVKVGEEDEGGEAVLLGAERLDELRDFRAL